MRRECLCANVFEFAYALASASCVCVWARVCVCTGSSWVQKEVLRPISLPIPLQVHMCFISRQAHQTVNSNGVLAWGYAQPGVEKEVSQKNMTVTGDITSVLSSLYSPCFLPLAVLLS